jgi:murein DD-endopeptidase MepM/ murein hydrolase activator NlpD
MARWPLDKYRITQRYHFWHKGTDLANVAGTPVKASASGKVIYVVYGHKIGGNYVGIKDAKGYEYYTGHHSSISVKTGQTVKEGQVIARVGSTGLATGPHVHYQIKNAKGQLLNPEVFHAPPKPAYPKTVTVKAPILYVRDKPTSKSKLAGSRVLTKGMRVRATAVVTGQSVNGNNKWYKSVHGNYFWSGGCK